MLLVEGDVRWSASDLSAAADCEFQVLCRLDVLLGRASAAPAPQDPLLEHIARLGDRHEDHELERLRAEGEVRSMARVSPPYTEVSLRAAADHTRRALAGDAVLYQPAFYDGEFFGYADFVLPGEDGWQVWDAKLAREAKPRALLQLGAYVDQLLAMGVPVAPRVGLLLGDRSREEFPISEVLPVFRERRNRLRQLLIDHRTSSGPVQWGRPDLVACGRCADCTAAIEAHDDLWAVAGVYAGQRTVLRAAGVTTMPQLAALEAGPEGIGVDVLDRLRAQAKLQVRQRDLPDDAPMLYELKPGAAVALAMLPQPSPGDWFFDFEGDPLYDEGDPAVGGLEYLWGILDSDERFDPWWALDRSEEREVFIRFVETLTARRAQFPDMHVYHYAPYETSALKRLAIRYQTHEDALDDLLRAGVFVDLYATVRAAIRIGKGSYSIKKLEPLYMGDQLRDADGVTAGDASIVAFHEFLQKTSDGDVAGAERIRSDLADYNGYDCLSTLRLRDWLLARAPEAGVVVGAEAPAQELVTAPGLTPEQEARAALVQKLVAASGPLDPAQRTAQEQARALLAAALSYYRREEKVQWWQHIDLLGQPREELESQRDVFVIDEIEVQQDWTPSSTRSNAASRRVLRLTGRWGPGSAPGSSVSIAYDAPGPPKAQFPTGSATLLRSGEAAVEFTDDPDVVVVTESRPADLTFPQLPVALLPGSPPRSKVIADRIALVAQESLSDPLPQNAVTDLLTRRSSRLVGSGRLPHSGDDGTDIVTALTSMADSYVAVQGPPGTGKTHTACAVIRTLVEQHHWRIGVVAQSHAVVEHLLDALVRGGLEADAVGKMDPRTDSPEWTDVTKPKDRAAFLARTTGLVYGGTTWKFCSQDVPPGSLDLLVVEEAGQFSLAATIGAGVSAKRLLLVGDPQQLPQVSQASHPEAVDESALAWLMDGADTIAPEQGYFLAESFRMHPVLCERVSQLSYGGRLHAAEVAAHRELAEVPPGLGVVTVPHVGNSVQSPQEADAVVAQVTRVLGTPWRADPNSAPRPLEQRDVLVVAPYNAQVALIRDHLAQAELTGVSVGTVDRFQGRQAPVVIMSMTASSRGDVPRGMGFLLMRNRINVAISRAMWSAVIIRSDALTAYLPTTVDSFLELGAFLSLCDGAAWTRRPAAGGV
ncbi:uncharacterized protein ATK17_0459 [Branchiibius hedensis]|uniref:AAA+ ATPase domain-containing protein n=1 Tax=Branchiibius hedensis TaxID=672460 RepID=A0A2Y8ZP91_9MICO|nr:bifunctional RecB family nuclease/DEAD/DEAH box helicase [Branchiibius hedensis]PWJ24369.1 uncharacterized protein ATK17_0459 [Branchiibius hedensis]SSA33186.1 uncharacterized protein SAMN04489750_0459 [Branchiibius hedensis]